MQSYTKPNSWSTGETVLSVVFSVNSASRIGDKNPSGGHLSPRLDREVQRSPLDEMQENSAQP